MSIEVSKKSTKKWCNGFNIETRFDNEAHRVLLPYRVNFNHRIKKFFFQTFWL